MRELLALSLGGPFRVDRGELVGEAVSFVSEAGDLQADRPEILELLDVQATLVAVADEPVQGRAGTGQIGIAVLELPPLVPLPSGAPCLHVANGT